MLFRSYMSSEIKENVCVYSDAKQPADWPDCRIGESVSSAAHRTDRRRARAEPISLAGPRLAALPWARAVPAQGCAPAAIGRTDYRRRHWASAPLTASPAASCARVPILRCRGVES
jgi:hypothetical protein